MFLFQKNSSEYLYHYTKVDTAINYILKDQTLRFSRFNATNDPKESKNWFFIPGTNQNRNMDKYTPDYLSKVINPHIKDTTHLLCFSKDKTLTGNHIYDLPKRGFCKSRMWAQYGDNHTGVCLVFNNDMLAKTVESTLNHKNWTSDNVIYTDRTIDELQMDSTFIINIDMLEDWGEEEYAFSHAQKYEKRLFFEKATDWQNEDEYRWVVFDNSEDIFLNYQHALKGIVFGQYCTEENISKVINLTRTKNIHYQRLNWRNCAPWLDFDRKWE